MLRYLTAGETHGPRLTAIIEGMPSGIKTDINAINSELAKRQSGYGRGGRMQIEKDAVQITSGVRNSVTLGSPITLEIQNKDWANWEQIMGIEKSNGERRVNCPRPGHADLTGMLKYDHDDIRNVLERASARETAARVAVGALCKQLLSQFNITLLNHVVRIGSVDMSSDYTSPDFADAVEQSPLRCADKQAEQKAIEYIDAAKAAGESCGGVVEVVARGVPAGLGSYVHYDRKLDANIAFSVMSIQAIKGVEFGMGFDVAKNRGSAVHDEIYYANNAYTRKTNNAGGIEGGMSNGEDIIVRAAMKPIPTLYTPLNTVNIDTKEQTKASVERSDICAVPACAVVCEAAVAFELAKAFLEKFGGDCVADITASFEAYKARLEQK